MWRLRLSDNIKRHFFQATVISILFLAAKDGPLPQNEKKDWMKPTQNEPLTQNISLCDLN